MLVLLSQCIGEIEGINAQLIRNYYIAVIRYLFGHPVMSSNGLKPPDFIFILESDAVHFIGAELFMQLTKADYPFPCGMNVRQHDGQIIFFTDSSFYQRVSPQHSRIRGYRFCF